MDYTWDFSGVFSRWSMLAEGLGNTLRLALLAVALGILCGAVLTTLRMAAPRPVRAATAGIIAFYRSTPGLVHFFWIYYALPIVSDISLDAYMAAVIALAGQSSAFYAEVFRGGVQSVPKGQWEGARALGMSSLRLLRRIVLPQAMRRMSAPFVERTFELIKTTSLASTLAYGELMYQAMQIDSQTFRPLETYTILALLYILLLGSLSALSHRWERHLAQRGAIA